MNKLRRKEAMTLDGRWKLKSRIGDVMISTVELSPVLALWPGTEIELLFETLAFRDGREWQDEKRHRCATKEEAISQHKAMVELYEQSYSSNPTNGSNTKDNV